MQSLSFVDNLSEESLERKKESKKNEGTNRRCLRETESENQLMANKGCENKRNNENTQDTVHRRRSRVLDSLYGSLPRQRNNESDGQKNRNA